MPAVRRNNEIGQVAVVTVHDTLESGEIRGRARMKRVTEISGCRRQLGNNIGYGLIPLFEAGRAQCAARLRFRWRFWPTRYRS
jgi:hypothetical protein